MTLEALSWRYATKKFDTTKKVSPEKIEDIIEAFRLTPTAYGVSPFKLIIVENPALREQIRPIAWNQSQITEASHLLILARRTNVDAKYIDNFISQVAEHRNIDVVSLDGYKNMILGFMQSQTPEQFDAWLEKQTHIALGILLSALADMRIDSCPIAGFDPIACDTILGLSEKNLASVLLCPIGYRDADDKYATIKKFRPSKHEIVVTL